HRRAEQADEIGDDQFEHWRAAVDNALDVHDDGAAAVAADKLADRIATPVWDLLDETWTPAHCEALAAVANALDWIREQLTRGVSAVVRVSLQFLGAPELAAIVIGELAGRAFAAHFLWPLRDIALGLRVLG